MTRIVEVWRRLMLLLQRETATRDLEEEMRLHRDLRAETLRQNGMSQHEAGSAAVRRFGNATVTAEVSRDEWGWMSLDALVQDMKYAARRLRQRPAFTASVAGVLALGIGATTAMFSAVDAVLLKPLPFVRSNELFSVALGVPSNRRRTAPVPENERSPDITDGMKMTETFSYIAAYAAGSLNLSDAERPMRIKAGVVTPEFFATLGVMPVEGRAFGPDEGKPNGSRSAIISWGLWQRNYGGRDVIGSTIPLNTYAYQIVGIMPRGFGFPDASDVWIPMTIPTTTATFEAFRGYMPSTTVARTAPGVTAEVANAQLTSRWERFYAGIPNIAGQRLANAENHMARIRANGAVSPLRDDLVEGRARPLLVLFGATVLLLLIACTNVTNLLLAYGASRRREIAVRGVLGATRWRVVRQLLAESVLLSVGGAAVGVLLAPLVLKLVAALMPPALEGLASAHIDVRVLVFATLLAVATGITFGMWPAFGSTRDSAAETIKAGGGHGASSRGMRGLQHTLVGAELALTVMLLVGAGLMLRSFTRLMNVESGLRAERIGTLEINFSRAAGTPESRRAMVDAMIDRLRATPGIEAAAAVNELPFSLSNGGMSISIEVDGAPKEEVYARFLLASEDYFNVMGIRVAAGRIFERTDRDTHIAVVNEVFARKYWPGESAIGKTYKWGGDSVPVTIVGVVSHVREGGLDSNDQPQMYFPARAELDVNLALVARGTLLAPKLLEQLTAAVHAVDRTQAVTNVRMMNDVIGLSVASRRANTLLIALFGALALAVAVLGVYAVTSYAVAQRTREFGIRSALGASRGDLLRHVGSSMTWVAITGIAAGAGLAWGLSRVMSGLLFGVTTHDAATFVAAPVLLVLTVCVATLIPARRATKVNPVEVMRAE
jgi:putative ABC transport system permease protein